MRVSPLYIGLGVLGALALAGTAAAMPTGPWESRIRSLAGRLEQRGIFPGLGDFLVAVAYWESRGNPKACASPCGSNSARGWFQMRPRTAFARELRDYRGRPSLLFREPWAVGTAAYYAYRLIRYSAAPGQKVDWLAIRRGWHAPSLVPDENESQAVSSRIRRRFEEALEKTDQSTALMRERAEPGDWPGAVSVLEVLGAKGV